jgi:anti-sigma B factor antagonist
VTWTCGLAECAEDSLALEITHGEREGILILTLHGPLTFGHADLDLRQELNRLLAGGKIRVVFDLSDVSKLDTTGLGTLVFALDEIRKAGGNLALFNLNPSHIELLVEAQLATTFDVFQTEEDAINSFFADRDVRRYDILEYVETLKTKHPEP